MFNMTNSTITLLETRRGILGQGPSYEDGIKIADFTDYPEYMACEPSFLSGHGDVYARFLSAARERFPTETEDAMAISEYARQLMGEALDELAVENE